MITTINDLAKGMNDREHIDSNLLDFSKALDKVPQRRLSMKLDNYRIRGNILHWIERFLADRTQRVVIGGEQSSPAPLTSGVPQATVLGPLIFLVYINDLPSKSRLFADDSLLYRAIKSAEDKISYRKISTDYNSGRRTG